MAVLATLEDLKAVERDVLELKEKFPEAFPAFVALFKSHRKIGYKNICKLLMGEATPEKLKED